MLLFINLSFFCHNQVVNQVPQKWVVGWASGGWWNDFDFVNEALSMYAENAIINKLTNQSIIINTITFPIFTWQPNHGRFY